jgi:hypothetical protein
MHKLVKNADYTLQETNVGELPKNMGYSNNGGYTMDKSEYYRLLELQNKFAQQTENGVIIHDIAEPFASRVKEYSSLIENTENNILLLEKIIDGIKKYPSLERCNTIVYYKETCISLAVSEEKTLFTTFKIEPTQFTSEKAEEICEKVTNGHGDHPIMGSKLQYSEDRLALCKKDLLNFNLIKKAIINNVVCG